MKPIRSPARRAWLAASAALLAAGCIGSSPPRRLYQLRALPAEPGAAATPGFGGVLAVGPVTVPEYLNRSAIVVRNGAAGLAAKDGDRWAEPLPDAFTRVLVQNLAARLGAERVWQPPLPNGLRATRQLRVDVLRLDADEGERSVVLAARWSVVEAMPVDAAAPAAPLVRLGEWRADVTTAGGVDALAAAHSSVVARLADAVAEALGGRAVASSGE
jgi:uncharacterized lipoprotein YmbA